MAVPTAGAEFVSTYAGQDYYFCCAGCRQTFDQDPQRYLMDHSASLYLMAPDGRFLPPLFTDFTYDNLGVPKSDHPILADAPVDNGLGDIVEDENENGVWDWFEDGARPISGESDPTNYDTDGDGFVDGADNCVATPNTGQLDADGDGVGDAWTGGQDLDTLTAPWRRRA